jgi:hypothetical protein
MSRFGAFITGAVDYVEAKESEDAKGTGKCKHCGRS